MIQLYNSYFLVLKVCHVPNSWRAENLARITRLVFVACFNVPGTAVSGHCGATVTEIIQRVESCEYTA